MRLDINLASQPYEDARQFWTSWGTLVGAMALFTLVLLTTTGLGWVSARRDRNAMSDKRAKIAECDRIRAEDEAFLNRPENRNTRDTSQFLNELIERKAFSWTRVLESLEDVMPGRVHLVSIHPELDEDNQLGLKMAIAGDSRDKAIELARRMEESGRFAQVNITGEHFSQGNAGDTIQFDMVALYIPEPLVASAAPKPELRTNSGSHPPERSVTGPKAQTATPRSNRATAVRNRP
jgi:Tfp pilus assembly protein PilN